LSYFNVQDGGHDDPDHPGTPDGEFVTEKIGEAIDRDPKCSELAIVRQRCRQ